THRAASIKPSALVAASGTGSRLPAVIKYLIQRLESLFGVLLIARSQGLIAESDGRSAILRIRTSLRLSNDLGAGFVCLRTTNTVRANTLPGGAGRVRLRRLLRRHKSCVQCDML